MTDKKTKFEQARDEEARSLVNRNMYELHEADARERKFVEGADWGAAYERERAKKLVVALRKIASLNMLVQEIAIATPEQLYNDTCLDIETARNALKAYEDEK